MMMSTRRRRMILPDDMLDGIIRATGLRFNGDCAQLASDLSMARTWYRAHLKATAGKTPLRKQMRAISSHARALRSALANDEIKLLLLGAYEGNPDPAEESRPAKGASTTIILTAEIIGRTILDAPNLHDRMIAEVRAPLTKPFWLTGSAPENLIGNDLLRLFTQHFGRSHRLSRNTDGRPKETPFTRFVAAVLSAFAISGAQNKPVAIETIYRAVSRMGSTKPNTPQRVRVRSSGAHRSHK